MDSHEGNQGFTILILYLHTAHKSLSSQGEKELVGTLRGFDEYVNMVLDDVVEYEVVDGARKEIKLDQILLNGAHICLLVPGGDPSM